MKYNDTLLVDGGLVNPLPYDIISKEVDITVAIDVSAPIADKTNEIPAITEVLFSSFQIMQNSLLEAKLNKSRPNILIKTNIPEIRTLEFMKAQQILKEHAHIKNEIIRRLSKLLNK